MRFSSTRNPALRASLFEAAVEGFPRDGGLYVPASEPDLRSLIYSLGGSLPYRDLASLASSAVFGDDLDPLEAARLAEAAYTFSPGIRSLDESTSLVDLSTGPSGSFKDYGMTFLAALLASRPESGVRTVLLATTGDTGTAAAEAFRSVGNLRLVLLYPEGRVQGVRRELLARNGGFVEAVRVRGGFEACRTLVRRAFERSGERLRLVPATSANIARLLAQVFYFLYAFVFLRDRNPGDFLAAVPSGNLGNLISGLYAWRWGVPITGFILIGPPGPQSSEALMRYLFDPLSGEDAPAPYTADDPENRERIRALAAGNPGVLRTLLYPMAVDQREASRALLRLRRDHGIFTGPETARAWAAARRALDEYRLSGGAQVAVFADSHPAKHAAEVERACGELPPGEFPGVSEPFPPDAEMPADLGALEAFLAR